MQNTFKSIARAICTSVQLITLRREEVVQVSQCTEFCVVASFLYKVGGSPVNKSAPLEHVCLAPLSASVHNATCLLMVESVPRSLNHVR